jgi:hypothetical protein
VSRKLLSGLGFLRKPRKTRLLDLISDLFCPKAEDFFKTKRESIKAPPRIKNLRSKPLFVKGAANVSKNLLCKQHNHKVLEFEEAYRSKDLRVYKNLKWVIRRRSIRSIHIPLSCCVTQIF